MVKYTPEKRSPLVVKDIKECIILYNMDIIKLIFFHGSASLPVKIHIRAHPKFLLTQKEKKC